MADDTKDPKDSKATKVFGTLKDKLIARKIDWARAGRRPAGGAGPANGDRLPPGQRQVKTWPVLDLGITPDLRIETWRLRVDGRVAHPLEWDWPTFLAQPQSERLNDIHCVTAWSRYDNHWQGVAARHLVDLVKPLADAQHVVFHAHDGYTTNVALRYFDADDVLIAHGWEGRPLAPEHGGPARIVLPRLYFWKSAKWIRRIEFLTADKPGFWETRGYHNRGDPWQEERYG
ncbi:MAG: sulfite oxidase-like oxidoreductase [Alphaproteobacteria bacterium]